MKLPVFIATRYTRPRKGQGVVSFISLIAIIAIAISMILPITVLSVMNGVSSEVRDKMLSMTAHMQVQSFNGTLAQSTDVDTPLSKLPEFVASAPYVEGSGLMLLGKSYNPMLIKGIDVNVEAAVSDVIADVSERYRNSLLPKKFNIIIGKKLAERYGLYIGDKVTVLVPQVSITVAGMQPRMKRFTVSGFFEAGQFQYDTGYGFINIDDAKILFKTDDKIHGFQVKLKDAFSAPSLAKAINDKQLLGDLLYAYDWSQQNPAYFDAVKAEKGMMFMVLFVILLVAMVNVLSIIYMVVQDKQRDIAILRTMGMQRKSVMAVFLYQGVFLGIIGTLIGVVLGYLISFNLPLLLDFVQNNFNFHLPEEMYFISELKPKIDSFTVLLLAMSSVVLSILATLIPAYKATKVEPAQALSYD